MPNSQLQRFEDTKVQFIDGDRGVNYPSKSELSKNGDCLFLNTGNVTSTGFVFDSIDFISFEKDQKLRKGKAAHEDIIMTTRGTVGNVAFFDPTLPFEHIRINSGMVIVRTDKNEYLPYFLYLFFRSELFRKQCLTNGSGSAQPQLPISALKNISIPKLGTKTQQTIIDVIQKLDKKVELNNKINAELEAMAKLIYDYWFVQFDFPDANGKPYKSSGGKMVYNAELKREIPDSWEVKELSEIAKIKAGGDKPKRVSDKKTLECSVPIYSNGIKDFGIYGYTDSAKINQSSVTISARGTIGVSFLRMEPFVPIIRLIVVTPKIDDYLYYLNELIKASNFENSGSVQKQLTAPQVSEQKVICPSNNLLEKYTSIASDCIRKIELCKNENRELTELRDWLLPMLMNGQVTVKDA